MKLYLVHVGFYDNEIGIYELHSNILVAAENLQAAKQTIKKKKIFIEKRMHIDGIQEINNVDGYDILLKLNDQTPENKKFGYDEVKALG